ncbi:MAG: hypothetical protein V7631_3042 [Massilia sp.]|jgi:hypothetical protein
MSEYPQMFGAAAGLSTRWPGLGKPNAALPLAAYNYLNRKLPAPQGRRLYQDHGDQIVHDAGYTDTHYLSKVFPGDDHNEKAWHARLEGPLVFLPGNGGAAVQ